MKDGVKASIGSGITWLTAIGQTNEIFQMIQIILASLVSLATLLFIIYKWWREASKDGQITHEEIDNLFDKIDEEVNKNGDNDKRQDL